MWPCALHLPLPHTPKPRSVFKGLQFWSEAREAALSTRVVVKRIEAASPAAQAELVNELEVGVR